MHICLVGATHPCHNPRLVREADSLTEAGHDVRVVAPSFMPELWRKDLRMIARRKWRLETVDYLPIGLRGRYRSLLVHARRRLARKAFSYAKSLGFALHAYVSAFPELVTLAASERADWFIAHTQVALAVAAAAAKRWDTKLGFDCEDLLTESFSNPTDIVRVIEDEYLPFCHYISVPSICIGVKLVRDYGIPFPVVLYNTFPLYLAKHMDPPRKRPKSSILRLHWFGQTIGPNRGIEDAVEAAGLLGNHVELHIRGRLTIGYDKVLDTLAKEYGVSLVIRPHVDHDDLIKTMEQFDIGLALERPEHGMYSRTVTNKLFSYLLAGLAVAATDTPGQREVMEQIPEAGFLYSAGKPKALADGLRQWLTRKQALRAAQQAAWDAARQRFCWDLEKKKFLEMIE